MDEAAAAAAPEAPPVAAPQPPPYQPLRLLLEGAGGSAGAAAKACRHHAYSRKQKSLGLLCSNFVALYDRDDVDTVGLDDAARRLGVERRRIYDIVNVLESVGILVRRAKNRYTWIGFEGVPAALKELKEKALGEMSGLVSPLLEEPSAANVSDDEDEDDRLGDADGDADSEKLSQSQSMELSQSQSMELSQSQSMETPSDKPDTPRCQLRSDHRKEKSLGLLTQNFVKLFLTMELETISLDEAARLLLGERHAESNMRTKVRRLYDIANVLSSLNLIEKTHQVDSRKPAFRWLGQAKRKEGNNVTVALQPASKVVSSKRAFGTDITNIDNKRGKFVSETENKGKLMQGDGSMLKTFESQLRQGKSSGFVYGPFHPAGARKHEIDDRTREKESKNIQDWESLATSFRPQYQNQALNDLFGHYVEAWKSWYLDVNRESTS
ncbi:E2F transcription factor-like E2FE [Lolium rigidum]|uniref:E2F transcription factor-like E2FE n=1 Tax=Lolium rigidum TaxID=89674 RepID=UPI001F5D2ACF|nr:E2F transcription factor-like E2FE [Lolium rigidum]